LRLDVRSATTFAIILFTVWAVARQLSGRRGTKFVAAASFERAFICALFALWQVANRLTRGHTTGGLKRGRQLWHAERVMHLPNEKSVQDLIINHPTVVRAANYYYDTAHITLMVVFLIWLWLRHRDRYPFYRNMMVVFTGLSLLVQMVSVAPPRLIGGTGLVDTAQLYGQSVYATFGDIADQYAAMPSIHVGWAMLISLAIVGSVRGRWRWVGLIYGPLTFFVVVATANHYWLDGIGALALLVVAWYAATSIERLQSRESVAIIEPPQIQQGAFS
jgi:PAP2 superfamily